ncbi:Cycloeucalenol cycloisomerase [Carex littledalei]|uniref:Cycloeucalenol cycloisomerase n=1 Tax=Carex littledalei TaxID=544730 RepID=A0A833R8G3_9POAL|nr:Cycloeucalenol cycloisomerase [Carex littledalei]
MVRLYVINSKPTPIHRTGGGIFEAPPIHRTGAGVFGVVCMVWLVQNGLHRFLGSVWVVFFLLHRMEYGPLHSEALIGFAKESGSDERGEMRKSAANAKSDNRWLASNPSKRWGEAFFLLYTPFWLTLCLGIVVPFKLYENFKELEYLLVGLVSAVPAVLIPIFIVGKADSSKSWKDRYWVKANLWIIIFSYVGNYFWTHYFFRVLGASYTFPSWRMNNVPHTTFLLTHTCFLFYHMASNMTLRRLRYSIAGLPPYIRFLTEAAWVLALSYFIAYLETLAISNFPYYDFVDRSLMYTVGSLFYAIYFFVSFPMFLRIDENTDDKWSLPRVAIDALGAAMLVTIILDLWRIFLGPIVTTPESRQCIAQPGLAWFSEQNGST